MSTTYNDGFCGARRPTHDTNSPSQQPPVGEARKEQPFTRSTSNLFDSSTEEEDRREESGGNWWGNEHRGDFTRARRSPPRGGVGGGQGQALAADTRGSPSSTDEEEETEVWVGEEKELYVEETCFSSGGFSGARKPPNYPAPDHLAAPDGSAFSQQTLVQPLQQQLRVQHSSQFVGHHQEEEEDGSEEVHSAFRKVSTGMGQLGINENPSSNSAQHKEEEIAAGGQVGRFAKSQAELSRALARKVNNQSELYDPMVGERNFQPSPPRRQGAVGEDLLGLPNRAATAHTRGGLNDFGNVEGTQLRGGGGGGAHFTRIPATNAELPASRQQNGQFSSIAALEKQLQHAGRREKFMPQFKPERDLYDEEDRIPTGAYFNKFVVEEKSVTLLGGNGDVSQPPSVKSFEECGFSREIMDSLELKKYKTPTAVQGLVIPLMQKMPNDLCVNAATGCGKSACWLLPIINELQKVKRTQSRVNSNSPYAIVLLPTKELCEQLYLYARSLSTNTGVLSARSYGDMPVKESLSSIRMGCDLFFTTSGRADHFIIKEDFVRVDQVRWLVFDEADKMVADGEFNQTVTKIKDACREKVPSHRQLMFSATFECESMDVCQKFMRDDFIMVTIGEKNRAVPTVKQGIIKVLKYDKKQKLVEILRERSTRQEVHPHTKFITYYPCRTMVFVSTKRQSDLIAIILSHHGFQAMSLNSSRTLKQRMEAVTKFGRDVYQVLVSTDVGSRGLNFPRVELVINFDLPPHGGTQESYIHRIGRTGRAGNAGEAISFFDPLVDSQLVPYIIHAMQSGSREQEVPEFLIRMKEDEERERRELIYQQQKAIEFNSLNGHAMAPLYDWSRGALRPSEASTSAAGTTEDAARQAALFDNEWE